MTIDQQEHCEQETNVQQSDVTSSIINDTHHINNSQNEEKHQQQQQQQSLPTQSITPTIDHATVLRSAKQEIEKDLFQNIERLVREFVNRSSRQFPYFRVMRWTTDDQQPKIEEFVTVVINQSPIQIFP